MKSVGVHVASDALALGNLAGAHPEGGAVIIMGDDPWCDSTQVPADSRFLCEHLRMAVVEPGTPQELKDWIDLSFKLSQAAGLYIGYIVTTAQADGGGTVDLPARISFPTLNTQPADGAGHAAGQPRSNGAAAAAHVAARNCRCPSGLRRRSKAARELGLNRIISRQSASAPCLPTANCDAMPSISLRSASSSPAWPGRTSSTCWPTSA